MQPRKLLVVFQQPFSIHNKAPATSKPPVVIELFTETIEKSVRFHVRKFQKLLEEGSEYCNCYNLNAEYFAACD